MYTYKYPRPALTVDAIVFVKDPFSVLLIRRGKEPYKGKWALPGGFVEMNELLEVACIRELGEETGLEIEEMQQFRAFDSIGRDPRGRTISVVFFTELGSLPEVRGGDDADLAGWFSFFDLPPMAFDHQQILQDFYNKKILK
ncbi:MAG: NUDIX hydrolase [Bacteroidales bacterium]|jgi:8-oxo-dGTP diphosphatase|nr:NUDIX hydrolase [Bacteroidales bacterium]